MSAFLDAAREFLTHRRLAVVGLSHDHPNPGNYIYRKLRAAGYEVFPVHPSASTLEGDRGYATLAAIPGGVDGVIITTHPAVSASIVSECAALGIDRVWLHRSVGAGSISAEAVALSESRGIALLDGGCPLMVLEPDVVHRCMRWVLDARGRLPDGSRYAAAGV
ncbi:MAG TPA: CoA-binding protein [Longimicrobiales bacterium]|nr:CoA-binding protein [Longimicrobiales bacterium]